MSNLYELYRKKTKYNAIRENVNNAINVLSRVKVNDGFNSIESSLENNYVVNDVACKKSSIVEIEEKVSSDLGDLRRVLSSINVEINNINRQINELEAMQNM